MTQCKLYSIQSCRFYKQFALSFSTLRPGLFRMTAYNKDDLILPPTSLVPTLFFNFEHNFYGLNTSLEERDLIIQAADLLDVLSPRYRHPFLDFAALNDRNFTAFYRVTSDYAVME